MTRTSTGYHPVNTTVNSSGWQQDNGGSTTEELTSGTEHTWEDSADYDIGDYVPYRVTGYLPQKTYRSPMTTSYTYEIDDAMQNLRYVDGTGHMFAFVKGPKDTVGYWYQVDEYFTITADAVSVNTVSDPLASASATINTSLGTNFDDNVPADAHDVKHYLKVETKSNYTHGLKDIKLGHLTNWGASDTHNNVPGEEPTWTTGTVEIDPRDIQYLQFRYKAELLSTANIGADGNANDARVCYTKNGTTGSTGWDRNRVFTYKILVSKSYDTTTGFERLGKAKFALYKKYLNYSIWPRVSAPTMNETQAFNTPASSGGSAVATLHAPSRDLLPAGVVLENTNAHSEGDYYYVTPTTDGGADGTRYEWNGLDDGHYILVELSTPDGYKSMEEPFQFMIQAEHDQESDNPQLLTDNTNTYVTVVPSDKTSEDDQYVFGTTGTLIFNNGNITVNVRNRLYKTDIDILKIDEATRGDSRTVLDGAKFKLYRVNNQGVWEVFPDEVHCEKVTANGTLTFDNLPDGAYKIEESHTPDGYIRAADNTIYFRMEKGVVTRYAEPRITSITPPTSADLPYIITWGTEIPTSSNVASVTYTKANPDTSEDAAFTVGNEKGAALPATGGPGTVIFYTVGSIITLLAAVLLITKRRSDAAGIE